MPTKSSQKVHLKNIVKIVVGDIASRKKQRRKRRRAASTKSGDAVNRSRQLIQELQTLSSRVNNVSNPQASNSATLLSKINEVETNNKIKSLEKELESFGITKFRSLDLKRQIALLRSQKLNQQI